MTSLVQSRDHHVINLVDVVWFGYLATGRQKEGFYSKMLRVQARPTSGESDQDVDSAGKLQPEERFTVAGLISRELARSPMPS